MEYRCEKGFLKEGDLEKINRFATVPLSEEELFIFTVTLCDNDIDRDYEKFTLSALQQLAVLFEGKTVIADHSMKAADQRARIFETYVEAQNGKTADGEPLYALKGRAYMLRNDDNRRLIDEIEAGIKKEGSVSCAVEQHICSICGADRKRERCGHIPSETYDGKLCFTVLDNALDAYEFSFVAVPAQKAAGVTKNFDITEGETMEEIMKTVKAAQNGVTLNDSQTRELVSYLEQLEDDAALGTVYKSELSEKVTALLKNKLPELEPSLIQSVVSVMTAQELIGFQKALDVRQATAPQLISKKEETQTGDYSQFKI